MFGEATTGPQREREFTCFLALSFALFSSVASERAAKERESVAKKKMDLTAHSEKGDQ